MCRVALYFRRTNNQDVVQLLNTIDLGQQLVDNGVVNSCATSHASSLLADGIDFIKDDDVQATVSAKLRRKGILSEVTI